MMSNKRTEKAVSFLLLVAVLITLNACTGFGARRGAGDAGARNYDPSYEYSIGPGDRLRIFVWRNPDISIEDVPVRPDGKISSPLVEDMIAAGKTTVQLARDIEVVLAEYIREPLVTVTVIDFVGAYGEQVRVVGEAAVPQALPYRQNMSLLDVMIAVGGLTEFAAGNRATVIRTAGGSETEISVRVDDLLRGGDISANLPMAPGDILIIPESFF